MAEKMLGSQIRYFGAALGLKLFGLNANTRGIYRKLGNSLFRAKHAAVTAVDREQGHWLYNNIDRYKSPAGKILELGTGWTHFYSAFLRCFLDADLVLFDIQDNRNLKSFKERMGKLADLLLGEPEGREDRTKDRIHEMSEIIKAAESFPPIYSRLHMTYVISPSGSLENFEENEFDVIFSVDVLEHISKRQLEEVALTMFRILKPGGIFLHQIGLDDHLAHYAPGMPGKNYLRYSERTSRLLLDNSVQYHNHLQASDYLRIFQESGFELSSYHLDRDPKSVPAKISSEYSKYPKEMIEAVRAAMVFLK